MLSCSLGGLGALPIRASEIDANASNFGCQQEDEDGWVVIEVINKASSGSHGRRAIHAVICQAGILDATLQDVQHLLRLRKQQSAMALALPVLQHLQSCSLPALLQVLLHV